MAKRNRKTYNLVPVDVSNFILRIIFEADGDEMIEWFESEAEEYFQNKIFKQVSGVNSGEIDDLVGIQDDPVKDPDTGRLTFYFVFRGEDKSYAESSSTLSSTGEDVMAFVVVLVDATTGKAYAIQTEKAN